jgi:ABC-type transport system involved in cytochrome bd biosynthesis fused ATPase/permease subunit
MDALLIFLLDVVLPLAVHWRVGVPTLIALPIAAFLAFTLSWFTGWYGVLFVIFAFGGGLLWESSSGAPGRAAPASVARPEANRRP